LALGIICLKVGPLCVNRKTDKKREKIVPRTIVKSFLIKHEVQKNTHII